ncbi:hypothetical protein [Microcystis phage Mel-JY01]
MRFEKMFSLKNFIFLCAIGLAAFSGYYSVFGIAKLFSGGSWSVIGMATMLEISKLFVIMFLHRHYNTLSRLFKIYLLSSAIILMSITSIGVYGYLTNSYQETAKSIYLSENQIQFLIKKKQNFEIQKSQIDTLIKQKSDNIQSIVGMKNGQQEILNRQLTDNKGTRSINKLIESTDKNYELLTNEVTKLSEKSLSISDSIISINNKITDIENTSFSSELGPLLYLSRLTDTPMDKVVNLFILLLVVVFDPLAISLIVAANHIKDAPTSNFNIEDMNRSAQSLFPITEHKRDNSNDNVIESLFNNDENVSDVFNIYDDIDDKFQKNDSENLEQNIVAEDIPAESFKNKPKYVDNPWNPKIPYKQ